MHLNLMYFYVLLTGRLYIYRPTIVLSALISAGLISASLGAVSADQRYSGSVDSGTDPAFFKGSYSDSLIRIFQRFINAFHRRPLYEVQYLL